MNIFLMAMGLAVVAAVALSCNAFRLERIRRRFDRVTVAQDRRGAANRALTAAYLAGADPERAQADVAAAIEAVRQAEAALPPRSRHTRHYFASKAAS